MPLFAVGFCYIVWLSVADTGAKDCIGWKDCRQ